MTSKTLVSPLASIFQQWAALSSSSSSQDEHNDDDNEHNNHHHHHHYRILIQSSQSFQMRRQAAETVDHPHLYQRANLKTPAETATRDMLGGWAWFQHILIHLNKNNQYHMVYIQTSRKTINLKNNNDNNNNMVVVDATHNPWGWDSDDDDNDEKEEAETGSLLLDLNKLRQAILVAMKESNKKPVLLAWESLSSLLMVHGFDKLLKFLTTAFDNNNHNMFVMQLWHMPRELLTVSQHAQLEDAVQALLCLQDGEMTLLRQGIRERGNIVRDHLPFQLVLASSSTTTTTSSLVLVEEKNKQQHPSSSSSPTPKSSHSPKDPVDPSTTTDHPSQQPYPTTRSEPDAAGSSSSSSVRSRKKIQLRHESDDDKVHDVKKNQLQHPPPSAGPRIFLQDDDPEFDDLDEEDPDDDLDI